MVVQDYIRIYEAGLVIKCSGRKLYVSVLMCRNYKWAHLLLLPVVLLRTCTSTSRWLQICRLSPWLFSDVKIVLLLFFLFFSTTYRSSRRRRNDVAKKYVTQHQTCTTSSLCDERDMMSSFLLKKLDKLGHDSLWLTTYLVGNYIFRRS